MCVYFCVMCTLTSVSVCEHTHTKSTCMDIRGVKSLLHHVGPGIELGLLGLAVSTFTSLLCSPGWPGTYHPLALVNS